MTTPQDLDLLDPRLKLLCHAILGASLVPGASVAIIAGDRSYHLAYGVKSVRTDEPVRNASAAGWMASSAAALARSSQAG